MTRMDITDIHELSLSPDRRRSYTQWFWRCTCGAFSAYPTRSKAQAEIAHHAHRYPDSVPPVHTMIEVVGEFGGPSWVCSCGVKARPEGMQNDRRSRQTFHRHETTMTLHWAREYHKTTLERTLSRAEKRSREAIINWHAKDPATRAKQAEYMLNQIL